MASIFSRIAEKVTGIPPIDFRKKGGKEAAGAIGEIVVNAFSTDILRQMLKKADEDDLDMAETLVTMERQRRAREAQKGK